MMKRTSKPNLERLETRDTPSVSATYSTGILTVCGDDAANNIVVSADAAGNLRVTNNAALVPIQTITGAPTTAGLTLVTVDAMAGADTIVLDRSLNTLDANGALAASPNALLWGGPGADFINPLIGGFLGGIVGNPIVGNVVSRGGPGNDFINSGFGNDIMFGGKGDDTFQWLPGTLVDAFFGGDGFDTGVVVGNDNGQADAFLLAQDPSVPGGVLFQRTNLVPFSIAMQDIEKVKLMTQSGDDTIQVNNLRGTDVVKVVADGGLGNDAVIQNDPGVLVVVK